LIIIISIKINVLSSSAICFVRDIRIDEFEQSVIFPIEGYSSTPVDFDWSNTFYKVACTRSIGNDRIGKLYKALAIEFIRLSVELHISKYIILSGVFVTRYLI
jgi:hypothetical protein